MKKQLLTKIFLILLFSIIQINLSAQALNVAINPSGPIDICAGEELVLFAQVSGGISPYTYLWTGNTSYLNSTTQPIVMFMSNVPGTYYLTITVTDNVMATAKDSIQINVKPLPNLIASGDTTICNGQSVNLWASGANTIIWFDEADNLIGWGGSHTVQPAVTEMFTVVGITAGCSKSKEILITVIQPPVAYAGASASVCEGQTWTLSDASASNYTSLLWTTSGDGSFSNSSIINPTYTPGANDISSGSVTLTLTAFGEAPCGNTSHQMTLTIFPYPIADAGSDVAICEGESTILTASGGATYLWSTGQTDASITVTPASTQTFHVTVSENGCDSYDSVVVTVNPFPIVTITPDQTICIGNSISINASGGSHYLWNTGDTTATIIVSPNSSTYYSVTVTSLNCSASAGVMINVSDPIASAGPDQLICIGNSATISAGGGISFLWSTGETTQDIIVFPVSNTSYQVTVTDAFGCTASAEAQITVHEINYVLSPQPDICQGESALIGVMGGTSWLWSGGETTQSIIVSPSATQYYYVTISDGICVAYDSILVNVHDHPVFTHTPDTTICFGSSVVLAMNGGLYYLWNTGETTSSITVNPNTATTYTVTVSNDFCSGTASITVSISDPIATAGPDQTICLGNTAIISATGGGTYLWSTGETNQTISVSPIIDQIYTVTITDIYGCTATAQTQILVIDMTYTISADTIICTGDNINIGVNGGVVWLWSGGETTSHINVSPISTQYYYVTITDGICSKYDSILVEVNPIPLSWITPDTTICLGQTVDLLASGGLYYLWNTGETTPDIHVNPIVSTTYSVTVSNDFCSGSATVTVTVDIVNASAGPNHIICSGDSATLTASGGVSYFWSTGETSQSIVVSPHSNNIYNVTVTSAAGCSGTAQTQVTVLDMSTNVAGTTQICQGEQATLTASGGVSYLWSTGETTNEIFVSPVSTQTYYVTVSGFLCSKVDSIEVEVLALPVIQISNDTIVCQGSHVNLWAIGGIDYEWNTGDFTSSITVSPAISSIYSVTVSDGICSNTANVLVEVDIVFASAGPNSIICIGDSATLTASGGAAYIWSSGETTQTIVVSPNSNQTYQVTVTSVHGCTGSAQTMVHVIDLHTSVSGGNICEGDSMILTASGGLFYQWSTGETTDIIVVSPSSTQTYYVTVSNVSCSKTDSITVEVFALPQVSAGTTQYIIEGDSVMLSCSSSSILQSCQWIPTLGLSDANDCMTWASPTTTTLYTLICESTDGCAGSDTVSVIVYPPGVYIIAGDDATICSGDSVQLYCSIFLGNQPPYTFEWQPAVWLNSSTSPNPIAFPPVSTTFYVTVRDDEGNVALDSVHISVIETPLADAGSDVSICEGENTSLTASGTGLYFWSTGETNSIISVSPEVTTEYILTVDNSGCTDTDTVLVTVKPLPIIVISDDTSTCYGENATLSTDAEGVWQWNTGETTNTIFVSPESSSWYSVQAELDGCINTESVYVEILPLPVFTLSNNLITSEIILGQWVQFEVTPDIYSIYVFSVNDIVVQNGSSNTFSTNTLVNGDQVTVTVYSDELCQSNDSWTTIMKEVPNGFSPNNDGTNDTFMPGVYVVIINRWGSELYRGIEGWDGKYYGKEVPAGTYFYLIELVDPDNNVTNIVKGSVLLFR